MKKILLFIAFLIIPGLTQSQTESIVKGQIIDGANDKPIENVNIVNLNQVNGTITNKLGEFEIEAKPNDTIHLSYLGYKSIKVRVTNDWINFGNRTTIKLTELALALEEVVVNK